MEPKYRPTQTISLHLLKDVEYRYSVAAHLVGPDTYRVGLNAACKHALSSATIAIAAWEAFVNERCLSKFSEEDHPNFPLWVSKDSCENWSLEDKTLLLPQLLFGKGYSKGDQPFQDFSMLLKLRNYITHFKIDKEDPKYLKELERRNIVFTADGEPGGLKTIPVRLNTCEMIRWAHNTVARMMIYFESQIAPGKKFPNASDEKGNRITFNQGNDAQPLLYELTDKFAREQFLAKGLDPDRTVMNETNPPGGIVISVPLA